MKKFHLSDILTVITGKMLSVRNMEGLYDILNYMTKDNLYTHQLVRGMKECRPYLVEQFPQLANIDIEKLLDGMSDNNLLDRIEKLEMEFGSYFEVQPLPEGIHEFINPIAEMFSTQSEAN